jgi:molybdenum cofactor synthesis domain-containing protein
MPSAGPRGAPTAAIVVIGDEILSAKVRDENSSWLALRLRALGIDLRRIVVVPDVVAAIADEVRVASASFDLVLTTGGVGPTHDDVTMAGIALAFGVPLERNPDLAEALAKSLSGLDEEALRMADLPAGAALWWEGAIRFPLVVVENVLVFPGVPKLLKLKFDGIAHRLEKGVPVATARLVTTARESDIALRLRQIQEAHPSVAIGSYPQFEREPFTVTITVDSRDPLALASAVHALEDALGVRAEVTPSLAGASS